jgi:Radical SAM superfamily
MIPLHNVELHVAHACNLSCSQCTHYSNHRHRGLLTPTEADREMGLWSHRLQPEFFSLLGGEPTLNPALSEIVRIARRHWPQSKLQLVTNGFLLGRHPDLPRTLEETGCRLEISVHHDSPEYQTRVAAVRTLVESWQKRHRLYVHWRDSNTRWTRTYRGEGASMRPYNDARPRESWEHCRSRWCPQIHAGKLWKCPQLAYLRMQLDKHGISGEPEWQPYLGYRPLGPECTDAELREFVAREDELYCSMCAASPETFELPSPLRS